MCGKKKEEKGVIKKRNFQKWSNNWKKRSVGGVIDRRR